MRNARVAGGRAGRALLASLLAAAALAGPAAYGAPDAPQTTAPTASRADSSQELGRWRVTPTDGGWVVAWRSSRRLPITSDRPTIVRDGISLGTPVVEADGRTVRVEVAQRPDPSTLDVVLSGDRLDEPGDDRWDVRAATSSQGDDGIVVPPTQTTLPVDPGTPGPFPVVTSDYTLDPVPIGGLKHPIEMVGHVVEPTPEAATGPRPLVLFLHGRHSFCYQPGTDKEGGRWPCRGKWAEIPSQLGYDYLQRVLASQGFTTVSIRANGINAQDFRLADGGAGARAQLVRAHLDHWVDLAAAHQTDLSEVVLVGHSRGGEGVNRAAMTIPLAAPYRIVGQVLLAPTDFGAQVAAYVPTVTVLPACDGDVFDLQGQQFTDVARDLVGDDTALHSSVFVVGADHNFFNTEWTPGLAQAPAADDWQGDAKDVCGRKSPGRLSAAQQRAVGVAYVAGAARLFAQDATEFRPLFDGTSARVASTGPAVVFSHAVGAGRDERRPGIEAAAAGGAELCFGLSGRKDRPKLCGADEGGMGTTPHWPDQAMNVPSRAALRFGWSRAGQVGGLTLSTALDLTGRLLDLRVAVDPRRGDVGVAVRLTDATGHSAVVPAVAGERLPALTRDRFVAKRWAQTLTVDPATAGGVDEASIVRVDLVSRTPRGRVWVLDVAGVPASQASVPSSRVPLLSLGSLEVKEGNGKAIRTARVPFTVAGTLTAPASVRVVVSPPEGSTTVQTVTLTPGQTAGSVPVRYRPDRAWASSRQVYRLQAFAVSGVMTDRWAGALRVRDDDPVPELAATLSRTPRRVDLDVTLSHPASETTYADISFLDAPGRDVTVGEVQTSWLEAHGVYDEPARTPLWKSGAYAWVSFDVAQQAGRVSVPLRPGARGGALKVLVRWNGQRVRAVLP